MSAPKALGAGAQPTNFSADQAQFAQAGWDPFTQRGAPGGHPGGLGTDRTGMLIAGLRADDGGLRKQNDQQLQTRLHGYLQGLTDAGMSNDMAQRYLYYELWNQKGRGLPSDQASAASSTSGGLFSGPSNTVKTQTPGIVTQTEAATPIGQTASHFKDPSSLVEQAGTAFQTQIAGPALDQFNQAMGIASDYSTYLSNKGKKGVVNPLTTNNLTAAKLGVPSGTQVTQDSLAQAAVQQYYDNTGVDMSSQVSQAGYNVNSPKGSTLGGVASAPIGNLWAGLKTGSTGSSSFDTWLQNLGVGQSQTPTLNYGVSQEQNAPALQGLMRTAFGAIGNAPNKGGPSQASWNQALYDTPAFTGGPAPTQQQVETLGALLSGATPKTSSQTSQQTLDSILSLLQNQNSGAPNS
jgi:hypothetical protein